MQEIPSLENRSGVDTIVSPPGPIQQRWALLVGVNQYVDRNIKPLKFCVNDVLQLQKTLSTFGYTVVALHDRAEESRWPTRENVEADLINICQNAGKDDLILVYFACHGCLVDGQPVLLTREIRSQTLNKALSLDSVKQCMRNCPARRRILILDACHTGMDLGRDWVFEAGKGHRAGKDDRFGG